jgi:3-hydroxybutyryl-CoA dehydratase
MDNSGKWFDEIKVGDTFSRSVTITEAHLVTSCGILGDYNPLHVDEEFAKKSRFGGRILHGMMTSAIMGGPIGMYFYGTAIAYLEHNARFRAPVRPGDTLKIDWRVTGLVPKPKHHGGIVELVATATNQAGEIAVEADGKVLAANRP